MFNKRRKGLTSPGSVLHRQSEILRSNKESHPYLEETSSHPQLACSSELEDRVLEQSKTDKTSYLKGKVFFGLQLSKKYPVEK
jgi:hypothetical protein